MMTQILDKLIKAEQIANNSPYKAKIQEELSERKYQFKELQKRFSDVKNEKEFKKIQRDISVFSKELLDVINAPGVDAFIVWLSDLTRDINKKELKQLRIFLIGNYQDYSSFIEEINRLSGGLNYPNSLFGDLLQKVKKKLSSNINQLLRDDQFDRELDTFFAETIETLKVVNHNDEFSYTEKKSLCRDYGENSQDFYEDYLDMFIKKSRNIGSNGEPVSKILLRNIDQLRNGIKHLFNSKIAEREDECIKEIFRKAVKEIKIEKGVAVAIAEFLNNEWIEIEEYYEEIKNFSTSTIECPDSLPEDELIDDLREFVIQHNKFANSNLLEGINKISFREIKVNLGKGYKAVERLRKKEAELIDKFISKIEEIQKEFHAESKKNLIDKLSAKGEEVEKLKNNIYDYSLGDLNQLKANLEKDSLLDFINEDIESLFDNINQISVDFEDLLTKSGMGKHLKWLNTLPELDETIEYEHIKDESNIDYLRELLSEGLIEIKVEKTY